MWNGQATVSRERGGAPMTTVAMARRNAVVPRVGRWCWWLKEVVVMASSYCNTLGVKHAFSIGIT